MKEKRVKVITTQWVILFLIFLIAVGVLLLHFSATSRTKEYKEVEKLLVDTAKDYAEEFENTIDKVAIAAEPMARFMEHYTISEIGVAMNVAKTLVDTTDAYMAVMCNIAGEGITQNGGYVDLRGEDYFVNASGVREKIIYSDDDGIDGRRCIIIVYPLNKGMEVKGFLLVYYDVANLEGMLNKMKYDSLAYYSVVDEYGKSVYETDENNSIFSTDNLWDKILLYATNTEEIQTAKSKLDQNQSGMVRVQLQGDMSDKLLIYAPTNISNWKFVIAINYSYVNILMRNEWRDNEIVLIQLAICVLAFAVTVAVMFVVSKLRENEKNKALVNKADTDLLTGLYNKVATECKITEYMQQHPDELALLFVLDIDNFKKINDTMGHAFGDEVLRSLGHQIPAYFRVSDIIGRTGGDEFMIFLKGMKDDETILKEARKLEYFFNNFQTGEYVKYSATASIGAAVFPTDAQDYDSLYKVADKALYIAKQRGKNQLAFYNEELSEKQKL